MCRHSLIEFMLSALLENSRINFIIIIIFLVVVAVVVDVAIVVANVCVTTRNIY